MSQSTIAGRGSSYRCGAAAVIVGSVGAAGAFVVAGVYAVAVASVGLIASPLRRIEEFSYAEPPRSPSGA